MNRIFRIVTLAALAALLQSALPGAGGRLFAQDEAPAGSDRFVVVVLPFQASDEGKAKDLQQKIIDELDQLGPYTLVSRDSVNDALKKASVKPGAAISDVKSLSIARDLGGRIVARGTLDQQNGQWVADPVFVEVTSRQEQDLPRVQAGGVDDLGKKIVQAFNARNQADKHVIFGRQYSASENYERAIKNFKQALEFDPKMASAYYYLGKTYITTDSLDQGLDALEKAVDIDPAYITAYQSIGQAYLEKGDTAQARSFFDQLVTKKPDDCDIQVAYGYVMANELDSPEKGQQAFEKAKQLCPDNPLPYQYLAYALSEDRRDEKIDNFKKYLELSEGKATDPDALQYLFGLYFADERYQEAQQTIDQALAADPNDANLQLYAGVVRDKLGQPKAAIQYFDKAVQLNPDLEKAYLFRGLAYRELGNTQKFAEDLEKAGRGQSKEIMGNLFLREAAENLKSGRAGAALESLSRASQLGANGCAISYYRGDAYYRMGKALQGEQNSVAQNQRARDLFQQSINSLQNACGDYASYAKGLIGNANQYITRVDAIIKKNSRS